MRLRRLEPVLRRALRGACHLPHGSTLLVAVSGGADSTALLVALASLARETGLELRAAHLHHGLRGRDADGDLAHVRELCARLRVPLAAARWDCAARMRRRGLSGEAGLRTLRREFLLQASHACGAVGVATAHTADDQLETLLLRLARGTGLAGAAGMRARHGPWLKPLLHATRADIERDLTQHRIAWREDASNASLKHARNRVRHAVVPALLDALGAPAIAAGRSAAERRAGLARRAAALARELAAAERTLSRAAARALDRSLGDTGSGARTGTPALDLGRIVKLAPALRTLILRRAWRRLGPAGESAPGLTSRHLEPLLRAVSDRRSRFEVPLPAGWRGVAVRSRLQFTPPRAPAGPRAIESRRAGPADARLLDRRVPARRRPISRLSGGVSTDGTHSTIARR
jgi:tRNA(Ile)-lysidine synthetase-like protein